MVAVISSGNLGVYTSNGSMRGNPTSGEGIQNPDQIYVNTTTGNLVIQHQDESLAATGLDVGVTRTYNSQGRLDDDNGDNWRIGFYRRITGLVGSVNADESKVIKVFGDGAEVTYAYDLSLGLYVSSDGEGADDTLSYTGSQWIWTEGATRNTETYDAAGRLLNSKDADGNTVSYVYSGQLLIRVDDASGQSTFLDYIGNNLSQIRVVSNGATQTLTRYTYDSQNRLSSVIVDLTQANNSVADNDTFVTTYTYDGTSSRIASIIQRSGAFADASSSVSFTYALWDGSYRVKTFTDGEGRTTQYNYASVSAPASAPVFASANSGALTTTEMQNSTSYHGQIPGALSTEEIQETSASYNFQSGGLTTPVVGWSGGSSTAIETGAAAISEPQVEFDASGNGFVLWRENANLLVRRYTASTMTWGPAATLDTRTNAITSPKLFVDGSGNAVATWIQSDGSANSVWAALYIGGVNGSWTTAVAVDTGTAAALTPNGAINNGGQAIIVWRQPANGTTTPNNLMARRYLLGAWQPVETLDSSAQDVTQLAYANVDGLGNIQVVWQQSDGTAASAFSRRFDGATGVWSSASSTMFEAGSAAVSDVQTRFTSSADGFALWRENANLLVRKYTYGVGWSPSVTLDTRTNAITSAQLSVEDSGNAIVTWIQSDGSANSVWASIYTSGAWSTAVAIDTGTAAALMPYGVINTFGQAAVVWRQAANGTSTPNNLMARRFTGGAWQSVELLESSTQDITQQPYVAIDLDGNLRAIWQQSDGAAASVFINNYQNDSRPYHVVASGFSWRALANTIYGVDSDEAGNALQAAMGYPPIMLGIRLNGFPTTLDVTTQQLVTVPPYYLIPANATWQSIANNVYGVNSAEAGEALRIEMNDAPLAVGDPLTGFPTTLTVTTSQSVTVPAYYLALATDTWGSAALAIYNTSNPDAVAALKALNNNVAMSAGLHVVSPSTLAYMSATSVNANLSTLSTTDNVTTAQSYALQNTAITNAASVGWTAIPGQFSSTTNSLYALSPVVKFDSSGNGFAVWAQWHSVYVRRFNAASGLWSSESVINGSNPDGVFGPSLAIDAAGNAIVGWVQGTSSSGNAYANIFNVTTGLWSGATLLESSAQTIINDGFGNDASIDVAISGSNGVIAFVQGDGTADSLFLATFRNGVWTSGVAVEAGAKPVSGKPRVAIDSSGKAVVAWIQSDASDNQQLYARQFNVGSGTWATPTQLTSLATYSELSVPQVTMDANGNAFVVVFGVSGVVLQASVLNAASGTWSTSSKLSPSTYGYGVESGPVLAVNPNGDADVVWIGTAFTERLIFVSHYSAASGTWSSPSGKSIGDLIGTSSLRAVARNGTLWAGWVAQTSDGFPNDAARYAMRFDGSQWSAPVVIQSGLNQSVFTSQYPWALDIDNAGNLDALAISNSPFAPLYLARLHFTAPYYLVGAGATWQMVANALYGVNSVEAGNALAAALPGQALVSGARLFNLPSRLSVSATATVGVPHYFVVRPSDSWASIATTVYGTSDSAVVDALKIKLGNPILTAGLHLTVPTTLFVNGTSTYLQTEVTDALLQKTTYFHNLAGQLERMLTPLSGGGSLDTRYSYDNDGNILTVTEDPAGRNRVTTYGYDTSSNLLSVRDADGNTVIRTYDSANQLVTESKYVGPDTDSSGPGLPSGALTTRYAYDAENHLRFVVSADGRMTEYRYNAIGQLTAQLKYTDSLYGLSGLSQSATLNESQLADWAATNDQTAIEYTDYTYDFRGNLQVETSYSATTAFGVGDGGGFGIRRLSYSYDQRGLLLSSQVTGNATSTFSSNSYDGIGRLKSFSASATNGQGNRYGSYYYIDALNRTRAEISSGSQYVYNITNYDKTGNALSVEQQYGLGVVRSAYDAVGRLRMSTDQTGITQYLIYDEAGRSVASIDGDGTLTEYVYSATSQTIKTVTYADRLTSATLGTLVDTQGKPANVTLATLKAVLPSIVGRSSDQITRNVYDDAGLLIYTIDPIGAVTKRLYDGLGRVTGVVQYANAVSITGSVDQVLPNQLAIGGTYAIVANAADDRRTRNFYDNDGHLVGSLDGEGHLVELFYDGTGHLTKQIAYANQTNPAQWAGGTLDDLRPTLDAETVIDSERDEATYFFYDRMGRQVGTLDAEGYLIETKYDVSWTDIQSIRYEKSATYSAGATLATLRAAATGVNRVSTFRYDGLRRLTQETNYEGTVTTYTYDNNDRQLTSTRASGTTEARINQYQYDLLGRVTQELTAEGSAQIALGMAVATAWDRYGISYAYDLAGRRISATTKPYDPNTGLQQTNTTYFYYNEDGQLRFSVNAFGERTEMRYNALGQVTDQIVYANRISTTGLLGGLLNSTLVAQLQASPDPVRDAKTTFTYTLRGQVASSLTAEGSSVTHVYNAFGNEASSVSALDATRSLTHSYQYDRRGLLKNIAWDPTGINTTQSQTYDAFGRVNSVTDANDNVRKSDYDRLGRVIATYDALSQKSSIEYDAFSRTLKTTDANSNVTTYQYNDSTRRVTVTSPKGAVTQDHNRHGEVVTVTNESNAVTTTSYNADGQVFEVIVAVGVSGVQSTTRYSYDTTGRTVTVTEGYGTTYVAGVSTGPRITQYLFDGAGRRIEEIVKNVDVNGARTDLHTKYAYDAKSNLVHKIDAATNSTWYVYDKDNRLIYTIDALGGVTASTYDVAGNEIATRRYATTMTPPAATVDVVTATSVTSQVSTGVNDRYEQSVYDTLGRRVYQIQNLAIGGANRALVTKMDYDLNGNVFRKTAYASDIAAGNFTNLASVSVLASSSDRVQWTAYDQNNRAVLSVDALGAVTRNTFDANGNIVQTTAFNNTITPASLNGAVRLTSNGATGIRVWSTSSAFTDIALSTDPLSDRTTRYWYDGVDRLRFTLDAEGYLTETQYNDTARTQTTVVYALPQTIAANATTATIAPSVDSQGRDQTTVTLFDAAGRVSRVTDPYNNYEEFTYDAVGNKAAYRNQKGSIWNYEYDGNHRLMKEISPPVDLTTITETINATTPSLTTLHGAIASNIRLETRMTYDQLGNVKTRTEAANVPDQSRTTSYDYDALGRQTKTTFPNMKVYSGGDSNFGSAYSVTDTQLFTQTYYDSLGNAYRNVDVSGNSSYKTYDKLGRLTYDVDAMGYVTEYQYDVFGNQTNLIRRANSVNGYTVDVNGIATVPSITSGTSNVSVTASVDDRTLTTAYDRLNRVTQVEQAAVYNYETTIGSTGGTPFNAGATTISQYNSFGQVIRSRRLVKTLPSNQYADTYFYYDKRGLKTAEVDPLNYLTLFEYDETGDLKRQVEYARPVTGAVSTSSYGTIVVTTPASSPNNAEGYDRETLFEYDRLNRKSKETKFGVEYATVSGVTSGTATGNLETVFGYDDVGNQISITANGATTYSYYDALGRVIAIAEPTRNRGDTVALTPLTLMRRDAYGNLVEQVQYARGTAPISTYGAVPDAIGQDPADRATHILVDIYGHAIHTEDANGADRFASYNARGDIAKEWQTIVNPGDGAIDTLVTLYKYDRLGRQITLIEPQRVTGTPLIVTKRSEYNAFGEVTRKGVEDGGVDSGRQEYFEYDQMGRVWHTNGGDGVDKVYLYNLAGNATAEIKSKANNSIDLATAVTSPSQALASSQTIRTETAYDVLGRVREQRQASFGVASPLVSINATFQFGMLGVPTLANAVYQAVTVYGDTGYGPQPLYTYFVLNPSATWAEGGGYYEVSPPSVNNTLGVYVRVAQADYQQVQKPHLYWTMPSEPGLTKLFEYRKAGSTGAWLTLTVKQVTAAQVGVDVSSLTTDSYEYRVSYTRVGDSAPYAQAIGTFSLTQSIVTSLSVSTNPAVTGISIAIVGAYGSNTLVTWMAPDPTVSARLEVRFAGSSTWASYDATYVPNTAYTPAWFTVELPTVSGIHEYRITHTRDGVTTASGTGSLILSEAVTTTSGSNIPDPQWTTMPSLSASASTIPTGNPAVTLTWALSTSDFHNSLSFAPAGTSAYTYLDYIPVDGSGMINAALGELAPGTYDYLILEGVLDNPYGFGALAGSRGQFVVTPTSVSIISQYSFDGYNPNVASLSAAAVPSQTTIEMTTISWPPATGIGGTPFFIYRPLGSSEWLYASIDTGGGYYNSVSIAGLSGPYEYSLAYFNAYFTYATATGQFSVSGASANIDSQSNWTIMGGTAFYLSGVEISGNLLTWSATPQPGSSITVTYYDTTGTIPLLVEEVPLAGANYTSSFLGFASGWYRYKISYVSGGIEYLRGSGNFLVTTNTTPASASATTPATPGQIEGFADYGSSTGYLVWSTPANATDTIEVKYKAAGAESWATDRLPWWSWSGGYAVNLTNPALPPAIDYEVTYTRINEPSPYMIGSGSATLINTSTGSGTTTQPAATVTTPTVPLLLQSVDRWGNVVSMTDAAINTTKYRYNQYGQLVEQDLPATTIVSTAGGAIVTSPAPVSATVSNYYDLLGRLIATRDGNGNVSSVTYNAANEVITETHADNGLKQLVFDAFGEVVQVTDELNYRTRNVYDQVGNLTAVGQELVTGNFTNATTIDLVAGDAANLIVHYFGYDEAGRRISETTGDLMANGTPETLRYWYDLQGNIVTRKSPVGLITSYEYDVEGHKTREADALASVTNAASTWSTDYFGHLKNIGGHTDLGGASYNYQYNELGLLTLQTNTRGQNIAYSYDDVGHLTKITESAAGGSGLVGVDRVTDYGYDVVGRRIRERVVVDGLMHQDSSTVYDELGRILKVADLRYQVTYSYDAAGNRTHSAGTVYDHAGAPTPQDLWYTYDAMNRVDISQGANNNGVVAISQAQGVDLDYDAKGERIAATQWGKVIVYSAGTILPDGSWVPAPPMAFDGYDQETYKYDGAGRLVNIYRLTLAVSESNPPTISQALIGTKRYDAASRMIADDNINFEGPDTNLTLVMRTRNTTYSDDGVMQDQTTSRNGVKESFIHYGNAYYAPPGFIEIPLPPEFLPPEGGSGTMLVPWSGGWSPGFDAAGNLRGYVVSVYNTNTPNPDDWAYHSTFVRDYRLGESYLQTTEFVDSQADTLSAPLDGDTAYTYNVNGELVQFTDTQAPWKNRFFANNAQGQALTTVEGAFPPGGSGGDVAAWAAFSIALSYAGAYNIVQDQHFFFANGQQIGSYGQLQDGSGNFKANFDVNYTPISAQYPASTPPTVVAQQGDTLRIIAARVFGDANLWYLIAEENGLTDPNAPITAGQALRIPNDVVSLKNDATSFKPFNAQDAIGDTTPTQPLPPPPQAGKKGCGIIGTIVTIIVAIVLTVAFPQLTSVWWKMAFAMIASTAGQLAGMAAGEQDKFNWKAVAAAGLTAGLVPNVGAVTSSAFVNGAIQGVANSIVGQGVNIALGLQDSFSWREVAISAAASGATNQVGSWMADGAGDSLLTKSQLRRTNFGRDVIKGATSVGVRLAMGGKMDTVQIVADVFQNAVGNSIADAMTPTTMRRSPVLDVPFIDEETLRAGVQVDVGPMPTLNFDLDNNPDEPTVVGFTRDEQRREVAGVQQRAALRAATGSTETILPEVVVTGRRIREGEDAALDMWFRLHQSRIPRNEASRRLIDQMGDWAGRVYNKNQRFMHSDYDAMNKMGNAYDALMGKRVGTGENLLGWAYGGETWANGQHLTGGIKAAAAFIANIPGNLVGLLAQPDLDTAMYLPQTAAMMRENAAYVSNTINDKIDTVLGLKPTNIEQQEAFGYAMKAQAIASLAIGGYQLAAGGIGLMRSGGIAAEGAASPIPGSYMNSRLLVNMEPARDLVGSTVNASGEVRNAGYFWQQMIERQPEMLSKGNLYRIQELGLSPRVDATWVEYNPTHQSFMNDVLHHHHINQGPVAVPLPQTVHEQWTSVLHGN